MLEVDVKRKQGQFQIDSSFVAEASGVTALFGESGSGKTSLINMVSGLSCPDRGRIALNDIPLFDSEKGINIPAEKPRFGYVFQDGRLFPHLNALRSMESTRTPFASNALTVTSSALFSSIRSL